MPKVWNLGSTTVRNPNRIQDGLRVYRELGGSVYGTEQEKTFLQILKNEGVTDSIPENLENRAFNGRKWRSTFFKLGFVSHKKYKIDENYLPHHQFCEYFSDFGLAGNNYELTIAGNRYINATTNSEKNDLILRQLLALELPSPIEPHFSNGNGRMKPFLFLLNVLWLLHQNALQGLNKLEIGIFILPFRNHNLSEIERTYNRIIRYRDERGEIAGARNKKLYDRGVIQYNRRRFNIERPNVDSQTGDYPDTTFRYARLSGLITNNSRRITLREDKIETISDIINEPLNFLVGEEPILYISNLFNGTQGLPTDDIDTSRNEIVRIQEQLINSGVESNLEIPINLESINDEAEIEQIRFAHMEELNRVNEIEFYHNQSSEREIEEILMYLRALTDRNMARNLLINGELPAYMEWSVWRAFLAINSIVNPISETRGFEINTEMRPTGYAPGGKPDMSFEFDTWGLATEVTLSSNSRQVVTEGEPVERHTYQFSINYGGDGYGLFIAPTIDINTAGGYLSPIWYAEQDADAEAYHLRIVPITLQQFIQVLIKFKDSPFSTDDLKNLFDSIIDERDRTNHPGRWLREINNLINQFVS